MRSYIRAIDGLRSIAVVAVVLFHAFPRMLPGGFIGVDVFFLISGFIITKTYFEDLQNKRVTLRHFFLKRVRRLAPIYMVVLLLTTIASYVVLIPIHLRHFAESLLAQPFYLQNIVFWHHGDYFEQALSKPLLHTWSLAVEEQFYLAYALFILVVRRLPRLTFPLLLTAVAVSLALAYGLSGISPKTAFYWLPTRVWQMGFGVLLALVASRTTRATWRLALLPGLGLVVWAIVGFDEGARFPGVQSVAACVGTALALLSVATNEAPPGVGLLTNAVPVHIGKLSYSLYLWHWPIIALWATALNRDLHTIEGLFAVAATGVLSQLGYTYLEKPVRTGRLVGNDRRLLATAAAGSLFVIVVALVSVMTDGATFRYRPELARLYVAQQARTPFRCPRLGRLLDPRTEVCAINAANSDANLLVLGDSHADVLDEVIGELAGAQGMGAYLTQRDCKLYDFGARPDCNAGVLERLRKEIELHKIKYVVTMAYTKQDFKEAEALEANASRLLESVDRIWMMQVVPHDRSFDPGSRVRVLEGKEVSPPPYTLDDYRRDNAAAIEALRQLAEVHPRITVLDPSSLMCTGGTCAPDTNGVPNYFDAHHLSPTGARRLAPMLSEALRSAPHAGR